MAPKSFRRKSSRSNSSVNSNPEYCLVCCEEFDEKSRFMAFGKCNHLGVCSLCYMRLRVLMKDMNCCLCKTTMDTVMVESLHQVRPFGHYEIWDENAGPDKVYDENSRMFLPKDYYRNFTTNLQEFRCRLGCTHKSGDALRFGSMRKMEDHYRDQHQKYLCHTCLAYKKVFLAEQQLFSKAHLSVHIGKGDPAQGFFGHPRCEFCRCRFYDKEHLYTHLTRDHYSCHVCERTGAAENRYYKDYADVEDHFRTEHYLCEHPKCLEKKFVVFDNDIDLKGHQAKEHPEMGGSRVIKLNFKVKRAGHDGSGFDSLDGGITGRRYRGQDGAVHEWEVGGIEAREENREMEARARAAFARGTVPAPAPAPAQSAEMKEEDFPGLNGGTASQGGASWAGRMSLGRGSKPKEEDFPALPPSSQRVRQFNGGARGGAFRNAVQSYATPAMQIYSQQGDDWNYPGGQTADDYVASLPKTKSKKKKGKKGGGGGGSGGLTGVDLSRLKSSSDSKPKKNKSNLMIPEKKGGPGGNAVSAPPPPPSSATNPEPPGLPTKMQTISPETPQTRVLNQIKETIGEDSFQELKSLSQQYRAGNITPSEYYFGAIMFFPPEKKPLFLALVSQLPDSDQRAAVLEVAIKAPSIPAPDKDIENTGKGAASARVSPATRKPKNQKNKSHSNASSPSSSPAMMSMKKATGLSLVKPSGSRSTVQQLPVHTDFPTLGSTNSSSKNPLGPSKKTPPPGLKPNSFSTSDNFSGNAKSKNQQAAGGGKKKKKNKKGTPLMNLALNFK